MELQIDVDQLKLAVQMARHKATLASLTPLDTSIQVLVEPEGLHFLGRRRNLECSRRVAWEEIAYAHEAVVKNIYATHLDKIIAALAE